MQNYAKMVFELAKDMSQMSVVVDADGLFLVQVGFWFLDKENRMDAFGGRHKKLTGPPTE